MKCILLAAGYSTRLYPLTLKKPKQLLKVGNEFMINHILERINEVKEIDEIIVVVNNKFYGQFERWLKDYKSTKPIKPIRLLNDGTNSNEERLGAIGDIEFAIENENIDEDVLIIGGDNLFTTNLNNMINLFKKTKSPVVAAYDMKEQEKLAKKLGVILIDKNSKIIDFEEKPEKPKSSLASTCIYLYTKDDIKEFKNCIKENNKPDNTGDFVRYLMGKKDVYCYSFDEPWYDIGNKDQLDEVNQIYGK